MTDRIGAILSACLNGVRQHSGLRKIVVNIGWLFADKLLNVAVGLFVGAWVARYLGPGKYGSYNYALAFVSLFVPFAGLGLADVVVRDIVRDPDGRSETQGTAFVLQFAAGLLALGLSVSLAQLVQPGNALIRGLIAILSGQLVIQAFGNVLDYWFQSQVESNYTVWARNIALILVSSIRIALILLQAPLLAFAWASLAETVLFMIGLRVCYRLNGQQLAAWRWSLSRAQQLLKDSWPLIFSNFTIAIYMKIGQIMLGNMAGEEALGLYSAALRLSELWYFIPVAIASSLFPAIIYSRRNQTEQVYRKRMQAFFDLMAGVAYMIVIPLCLAASPLVKSLFGREYEAAGSILAVHVWAFLFVSIGVAGSRWLIAENMAWFNMFATTLGAAVSIVLNILLIPKYGALGAAWAATVSYGIAAYLSFALSRRLWPVLGQLSLSLLIPLRLLSFRSWFSEIF